MTDDDLAEAIRTRARLYHPAKAIARDLGVHFSVVVRIALRYRIPIPGWGKRKAVTWHDVIADLPPDQAIEHLCWLLDGLTWNPGLGRSPLPGIDLTAQEAKILHALDAAGGRVVSREALLTAATDNMRDGTAPEPKLIDVRIYHLRRKLKGSGAHIVTAWGEGYALSFDHSVTLKWENDR